jgi:hypothetical protein
MAAKRRIFHLKIADQSPPRLEFGPRHRQWNFVARGSGPRHRHALGSASIGALVRAATNGGFVGHDRRRHCRDFAPVRIVFYAEATAGSAPTGVGADRSIFSSTPVDVVGGRRDAARRAAWGVPTHICFRGEGIVRGAGLSKGSECCGRAEGCSEADGVASANPSDGSALGLVTSHEASLRRPKPTIEPGRQMQASRPPRSCVPRPPATFTSSRSRARPSQTA